MFEKDAEEYGEKDLGDKYLSSVVAKDKLHAYRLGQYDGFVAGAEFGYNKANEWHYVKDGDLPEKEGRYYCAIKTTIITGGYKYDVEIKNGGRNVHSKKWFWADYSDPTWCELELMKVYAWKEIVPPKESK